VTSAGFVQGHVSAGAGNVRAGRREEDVDFAMWHLDDVVCACAVRRLQAARPGEPVCQQAEVAP
jgi:hypothetical protein